MKYIQWTAEEIDGLEEQDGMTMVFTEVDTEGCVLKLASTAMVESFIDHLLKNPLMALALPELPVAAQRRRNRGSRRPSAGLLRGGDTASSPAGETSADGSLTNTRGTG